MKQEEQEMPEPLGIIFRMYLLVLSVGSRDTDQHAKMLERISLLSVTH